MESDQELPRPFKNVKLMLYGLVHGEKLPDTLIASNIWQTFSSRICCGTDLGSPAISKHSLREYWAFAQHYRSITTAFFIKRFLAVLEILTSASSFLKLVFISFTSSLKDYIVALVSSL